jgi:hypothetical protein
MLHAQIGLPRIEPLFSALFDPFVAITAVTAAARAGRLLAATRLARFVSALPHEEPRSRRSFAQ